MTEDVYIKGKKIGPGDYRNLATFFNEEITDPKLWNAVLHAAAGSHDMSVRRILLSLVLEIDAPHEGLRKDTEALYRALLLVHNMKRKTGFAGRAWRFHWLRLSLGRLLHSKNLLIFLTLVTLVMIFLMFFHSEFAGHHHGLSFRPFRMFSR